MILQGDRVWRAMGTFASIVPVLGCHQLAKSRPGQLGDASGATGGTSFPITLVLFMRESKTDRLAAVGDQGVEAWHAVRDQFWGLRKGR